MRWIFLLALFFVQSANSQSVIFPGPGNSSIFSASWTPASLTGLVLWLKKGGASGITWTDSSGQGNNFTLSGATINGDGTVTLPSTGSPSATKTSFVGASAFPFFCATRLSQDAWVANGTLIGFNLGASDYYNLGGVTSTPTVHFCSNVDGCWGNDSTMTLSTVVTLEQNIQTGTGNTWYMTVGNTKNTHTTGLTSEAVASVTFNGGTSDGGLTIHEVVCTTTTPTGTDLSNLETYMAGK